MTRRAEDGFTIMEALVALTILAIAAAGLVRAGEGHIDAIRSLQLRASAQWAAENALAELHVGAASVTTPSTASLLGQTFLVGAETRPTDDPDLAAVRISVTPEGEPRPLATLDGFLDLGARP